MANLHIGHFLDVFLVNCKMWSYVKSLKYFIGVIFEIIHVIIQTINHYIFSTTEKNIRNEIVLITGAGRGLGKRNRSSRWIFSFSFALFRSTNGNSIR